MKRIFVARGFVSNGDHGSFVSIEPNWPTGPDGEDGKAEGSHIEACLYMSITAAKDLLEQLPEAIAKAEGGAQQAKLDPVLGEVGK